MIKLVQIGLGHIGQQLTRYVANREGIKILGGVDLDPKKEGQDLGTLAGLAELGIRVSPDLETVMAGTEADVALISTVSSLNKIEAQIQEAAYFGLNVVSTCEELICPFELQPDLSEQIDELCKEKQIACIGTGVNPGFLMDYLPAVLSSVCENVDRITVERYQDAGPRRLPFQQKIGTGLTAEEFEQKRDSIRHVGLKESVYLISRALGWKLEKVDETLAPVFSEQHKESNQLIINTGDVAGVQQVATGRMNGMEVIKLDFKAAVGLGRSYDSIQISGNPPIHSMIESGVNGDIATSAIMVNTIRSVTRTGAGLKTMLDIPAPACFSTL